MNINKFEESSNSIINTFVDASPVDPSPNQKSILDSLQELLAYVDEKSFGKYFTSRSSQQKERKRSVLQSVSAEPRTRFRVESIEDAAFTRVHLGPIRTSAIKDMDKLMSLIQNRTSGIDIPKQKIAPAHFQIKAGKIAIDKNASTSEEDNKITIEHSRFELVSRGRLLLDSLEGSNCDRRAIADFRYLLSLIENSENIIRVGMALQDCDATIMAFADEMPSLQIGQLRSFLKNGNMYAAQFADWQKFTENAALAELEAEDVSVARNATAELAGKLQQPELADPEVPHMLKILAELKSEPGRSSKRLAFALVRTVENFVSKALSLAVDLVESTAQEAKEALVKPAGKAIAVTLLCVAIESATGISAVASKIAEARWMQEAVSVLHRELQKLISSSS